MGEWTRLGEAMRATDYPSSNNSAAEPPSPEPPERIEPIDVCPGERCAGRRGDIRYVPDGDGGGIPVASEYCDCPVGTQARAEDDRIRQAYRNGLRRARLERYIGSTRIPARYATASFDSFPVTGSTAPIVERLRGFAASCGEPEGRSIVLWGDFGVGKTGLAVATLRAAVEAHGVDSYFTTVPDLLNEIRSGFRPVNVLRLPYADDSHQPAPPMSAGELQRMVRDTTLLVLDDLGAERVTDWVSEALFSLINHRHNRMLRTVFTSNLDTKALAGHLGERTAWRIVEMADVIEVVGPNLRVGKAQR